MTAAVGVVWGKRQVVFRAQSVAVDLGLRYKLANGIERYVWVNMFTELLFRLGLG